MPDQVGALVATEIVRRYGDVETGTTVLSGVSLQVLPGETVAIVGPSGSGKSTLLNILGSLDRPTSGNAFLGDLEITALAGKDLQTFRATRAGFVFQDHHLLPQLTALENVLLPTLVAPHRTDWANRAASLLEKVGVLSRKAAFSSQMSGGERQRVALARALINSPALLLCDEPTGNLDRSSGMTIVSLLLEMARQEGVIVLMVTHNLELSRRFDRILELRDGHLISHDGSALL